MLSRMALCRYQINMCVAWLVDMLKTNASHNLVQLHSSNTVNENVVFFFKLKSVPSLYLDAAVEKLERRKTSNASDYGPLCTLKLSIVDHSLAHCSI